jgi:hypothetical protein
VQPEVGELKWPLPAGDAKGRLRDSELWVEALAATEEELELAPSARSRRDHGGNHSNS